MLYAAEITRRDLMRAAILIVAAALTAPAFAAQTKLTASMTGAAEAPAPGPEKAMGTAELTFDTDKGQVCYTLTSSGTDTPTAAHVHKGAKGVAGGPVIPLAAPANGKAEGCAPVAADVSSAILASPADYYVNVHTATFPRGAMRGQLMK
jgi:hypothetical protein